MLAQFRQFWTNLSSSAKVVYGLTAAVLVAAVVGVGYWSSQVQYQVLCRNVDPEFASQIVAKLTADKVAYKLSNDGTTISVPVEKHDQVKMNLAVALPQGGGKGYELFDTMSLGTTPFVQNINLIRAKEGELVRTIKHLGPVADVRVHLAFPDPTPFVRDEKPVTASVTITKTNPGAVMTREATAGIVRLVASSVTGLSAENVTVIDSEGRVISERRDSKSQMASNEQLTYQREVEANYIEKAQDILAKVLGGPGRAVVRVTAEMSFRHIKETSEKFDPEAKVAVHEHETSSKTKGVSGPRGITGAVSNIPPSATPNAGGIGPSSEEKTSDSEYAVSKVNSETEEQQGLVDRLTVAVILIPPKGAGDDFEEAMGINQDDVSELVKNAVGFKDGRDQIKVSIGKAPADPVSDAVVAVADAPVAEPPFLFGHDFVTVVRGASLIVAGLIALAMVVKLLRRKPKPTPAPAPAFAGLDADSQVLNELSDLNAVASTIKAWLEEPAVVRFDKNAGGPGPQAKPA